jgi:hypothetical protein
MTGKEAVRDIDWGREREEEKGRRDKNVVGRE